MKLSTVLTSALVTLATASPAIIKHEASPRSPSLADLILHALNLPSVPPKDFTELKQCMTSHRGYHADYSKADDGVFSITNMDHTCCEKAKKTCSKFPDDRYGKAVFNEPCDGATVTGVSKQHMGMLRNLFESL